jgi:hypothetical protein
MKPMTHGHPKRGLIMSAIDPGGRPTDPELEGIIEELREAGLLAVAHDTEGKETWTFTAAGAQVVRQMAMSAEDDALELLTAMLRSADPPTGRASSSPSSPWRAGTLSWPS